MTLEKLDHFVLPVSDIDAIATFYVTYLGMEKRVFGEGRVERGNSVDIGNRQYQMIQFFDCH